jgi:DNA-binding HxlR family transcriptional regulator
MSKYGQYCPVAKSLEILGDRWTLLIVRDMLTGTTHFNDLERGLPGVSRALLASRLKLLQRAGIIEKRLTSGGRSTTSYQLTLAGQQLFPVINSLWTWGEIWAFGDPTPEELNPVLLMWWLRSRAERDLMPAKRVVAQFDFRGAAEVSFWLIMSRDDVTLCLTDPGYEINLLVTADLATLFRVWGRRIDYREALARQGLSVVGVPSLVRAFPRWFGWGAKATPAEIRAMSAS